VLLLTIFRSWTPCLLGIYCFSGLLGSVEAFRATVKLSEQRTPEPPSLLAPPREATSSDAVKADDASQDVVLDYCAAVRGILNDDQGGPLHPPGLRMAEALADVHASLQRNVEAQKGGRLTSAVPG